MNGTQMSGEIIRCFPTSAELLKTVDIPCLENSCKSIFNNYGQFNLHMLKHHKIGISAGKQKDCRYQYFCPETDCKYNINKISTDKHLPKCFQTRPLLKQHYIKVHVKKTIFCEKCNKYYSNLTQKSNHQKFCGQSFQCMDCDWKFNSREALLTHCKRKEHTARPSKNLINEKRQSKIKLLKILNKKTKYINIFPNNVLEKPITKSKETQTEISDVVSGSSSLNLFQQPNKVFFDLQHNNQSSNLLDKNEDILNEISVDSMQITIKKKSIDNFELFDSESNNLFCNSSSQTYNNLNRLNYVEDDSLHYFTGDDPFNSTNNVCSIETQTDLIQPFLSETASHLYQMVYSDMHTQTYDDGILTELGLSDIQTQTNWSTKDYSDILVSTETQTSFSGCLMQSGASTQTEKRNFLNIATKSSDIEFGSLISSYTQTP